MTHQTAIRATEDVSSSYIRQIFGRVRFRNPNNHIWDSVAVNISQGSDRIAESVSLVFIRIEKIKENTVIRAAEDKRLAGVYVVRVEVGVMGNPDQDVRDTVMINISQSGYGEAEETTELREIHGLLKIRIVKFRYLRKTRAVDEESSSHILRRTKPIGTTKL